MADIHVLDASVYNKISAGEVVEKPSSVVKELVENALDAGATEVFVRFTGGGLDEICVSDNGKGISADDLDKVFLPHATSKITTAEDLFHVGTLGFRGEAMASIAAVAMVKLTSRQAGGEAYAITASGNEIGKAMLSSGAVGTTVEVRNLFYHTPARLKFLRSAKQEGRDIVALCERLIIANPHIRFTLTGEGKTLLQTTGDGLESAVCAVFGEEAFGHMLHVAKSEYGYTVEGYVSDVDYTAGTRANQITVVNGRVVSNATLSASVNNAYRDYLMKRNYALFALHIRMPNDEIDVNVHPTKADVRFVYANKLFGFAYRVVRQALEEYLRSRDILFNQPIEAVAPQKPVGDEVPSHVELDVDAPQNTSRFAENDAYAQAYTAYRDNLFDAVNAKSDLPFDFDSPAVAPRSTERKDFPTEDVGVDLLGGYAQEEPKSTDTPPAEEPFDSSALRVVGQVLGTYIVAEYKGELLLVDQHAAAERVLYNRIIRQYADKDLVVQPLLVPYDFDLAEEESALLSDRLADICALGIDIKRTGETSFSLEAMPALLVDMDVQAFVHLLLSEGFDGTNARILHEKLAYTACRAAVKGNTYMDVDAIKLLCQNLFGEALPAHCPHGRPAYIKLSKYQLDKMFKRIV